MKLSLHLCAALTFASPNVAQAVWQSRAVEVVLKCCEPDAMPRAETKCCGATGKWVTPQVDENTGELVYTCDTEVASDPNDLQNPPFGSPCQPNSCSDLLKRRSCQLFEQDGCRWLRGDKVCVNISDYDCSANELSSVRNCRSLGEKCKYENDTCLNRCKEPGNSICTFEFAPVRCGAKCEFSNLCVALSAGYKENRCKPMCHDDSGCNQGEVCYRRKYCSDSSSCPQGICLEPTANSCDGFLGTFCPEGEACVHYPCPPGVQDSCGAFCIKK